MKFKNSQMPMIGTCLQGNIDITYDKLVSIFGKETCAGDEYKVQADWMLTFDDGTVATIYDWKQGDSYNGPGQGITKEFVTDWHIGGMNEDAVSRVMDAISDFDDCNNTLNLAEVNDILVKLDESFSSPKIQEAVNQLSEVTNNTLYVKPTLSQVKQMAELADAFKRMDGDVVQVIYTEDEVFGVYDRETDEEYEILYSDVTLLGNESFMELIKLEIPE